MADNHTVSCGEDSCLQISNELQQLQGVNTTIPESVEQTPRNATNVSYKDLTALGSATRIHIYNSTFIYKDL